MSNKVALQHFQKVVLESDIMALPENVAEWPESQTFVMDKNLTRRKKEVKKRVQEDNFWLLENGIA